MIIADSSARLSSWWQRSSAGKALKLAHSGDIRHAQVRSSEDTRPKGPVVGRCPLREGGRLRMAISELECRRGLEFVWAAPP